MQTVSNTYKEYLNSTLSLSPKSKIVVGEIEYLGNVIMSTPKIAHSNLAFIGGFPSKTCSFELYNPNNNIDLVGKEIEVYRGLVINGEIEWVKQGIFIPKETNITNDITTKKYKVDNAQDKRQLLDVLYVSSLDWSTTHTGLEIVNDALKDTGVSLEGSFNWASYSFNQPNFPSNASKTEVISRIAELGGEIAFINRDGNLSIKGQTPTGDTIETKRYSKLTKENEYKVNTLVLGKEGANDDIVYKNEKLINKSTTKNIIGLTKLTYTKGNKFVNVDEITNNSLQLTINPTIGTWTNVRFPIDDLLENGAKYTVAFSIGENSNILPNGNYGTVGLNRVPKNGTQTAEDKTETRSPNVNTMYSMTTSWAIDKENYNYYLYFFPSQENTITENLTILYENIYLAKETKYSGYVEYKEIGIKEWKLLDNPYVDLIREEMIELVAPYIIGKSYIPFELTDFVDGFIYDLNDVLNVVDKNGETFEAVILDYNCLSRIKSRIGAATNGTNNVNYKIAGSVKEQLANVRLEVDHINNEIRSIVSKGYVNEEDLEVLRQSLVTQNEESITMSFNTLTEIMNSANAETQKQFQEQSKYIRFDGGISLGEVGNEVTLRIENETIFFSVSDVKIMEITPNGIKIEKVITDEIDMGDFSFIVEEDGSLSLV